MSTTSPNGAAIAAQRRCTLDDETPEPLDRPGHPSPTRLSYSSLSTYGFCPARWALERLDRHPPPATIDQRPRLVGSATRAVLANVATGADLDAALAEVTGRPDLAPVTGEVTGVVASCVDWAPADPHRATLRAGDVRLEATIDGVGMVATVEAVELDVDGVVTIAATKTGRTPSPQVAEGPDSPVPLYAPRVTRALVLYAEMADAGGVHVGRVRLIYPATRTVIEVDLDSERGRLLRIEARRFVTYEANRLARSLRTGVFVPAPSDTKCASCDMADHCPAAQRNAPA